MAILSPSQSFLGVDLGASSIKLVELKNDQGRPRLGTYVIYDIPLSKVKSNDWSDRKMDVVSALKQIIDQSGATSKFVISALPTFAVFSSLITVAAVSDKELPNAIRLEAKKVVPRPIEEMILDWKEVEKTEIKATQPETDEVEEQQPLGTITGSKGTTQRKILITAAPKDLVQVYLDIFKEVGLRLVSLETEALALSRSLIGRDPSVVMVVDIGGKTTNLSIVEHGIPLVNRGVNFGGINITQAMSEQMGVDEKLIEQWKRDKGLSGDDDKLSPAIETILDDLLHEILYLFQLYRRQFEVAVERTTAIDKVVLAGGSAFVPGLANYLADKLNVPVHLGDPWARIIYPEDLSPVLQEIGPAMAVAVGLAMRPIVQK